MGEEYRAGWFESSTSQTESLPYYVAVNVISCPLKLYTLPNKGGVSLTAPSPKQGDGPMSRKALFLFRHLLEPLASSNSATKQN